MFRNRNFQNNRRQNGFRTNGYNAGRNPRRFEDTLPQYVLNVYRLLKNNADVRRYTALAIKKLLIDAGKIQEGEKVYVDFNATKYKVTHYTPSQDKNQFNPNLGEEFAYNTREFYVAVNAACSIMANVMNNNLSIYYSYIEPTYNQENNKELEKDFQSCIDTIVGIEVRRIAAETQQSAESDATEA